MKKILTLVTLAFVVFVAAQANDYIAIGKDGKVYDEASAKYVTLNQNNEEVNVIPGMVFKTTEHVPGWYKVEYSPGLHAFIPEQIAAADFKTVSEGTYAITNDQGHQLIVSGSGNDYSAEFDGRKYKGIVYEDILIFTDTNNNIAFSLVDLGNGPIAISYDNSLTKFF